MLFPAQDDGAERRTVVFFSGGWRRQTARFAEGDEIGAVGLGAKPGRVECEMEVDGTVSGVNGRA